MNNIPILEILLFCLGIAALIKGGDWFVDGATGIAKRFHIPELIIGATVVSIGTTLPEVMVSATSALRGVSSMAYGNAIGSVICNTALIAALSAAVRPVYVDRKTLAVPVAFFFGAAAVFAGAACMVGGFSRAVGTVLLVLFVCYITYTVWNETRNEGAPETDEDLEAAATGGGRDSDRTELLGIDVSRTVKSCVLLAVGAVLVAVGASLLVDNGTVIAAWLGVPDTVIALTFIALGTSLPELVTSVTALVKGHGSLSLGNIIGANLMNLTLVSGAAATLRPFPVPGEHLVGGVNASLAVDLPVMLAVMAILTLPALIRRKVARWQGFLLLAVYAGFLVFQFL